MTHTNDIQKYTNILLYSVIIKFISSSIVVLLNIYEVVNVFIKYSESMMNHFFTMMNNFTTVINPKVSIKFTWRSNFKQDLVSTRVLYVSRLRNLD